MPSDERRGRALPARKATTEERAFDELARGLAGGVSRRKALRLMGAALLGGVLASIPGVAQAAPPGCSRPYEPCGNPQGYGLLCCNTEVEHCCRQGGILTCCPKS